MPVPLFHAAFAQPTAPVAEVVLGIVAATCLVTSAVIAITSRGRHLAWPVFLAVALLAGGR